ncbi:MAG: hypothetical protein AAFO94_02865, partial [Bacteroidota bacterium]
MGFESYFSLLSTLGIVLLGQRVLVLDHKQLTNRLLFILSIVLAMLTLSWYEMSQAATMEEAIFYRRHIAPWPFVFYLIALLAFAQLRRKLTAHSPINRLGWPVGFLLFLPALYFVYLDYCTPHIYGGMTRQTNGSWAYLIEAPNYLDYLRSAWAAVTLLLAFGLTYYNYTLHRKTVKGEFLRYGSFSLLACAMLVHVHVFVLPFLGYSVIQNATFSCFLGMLIYSWSFTGIKLFKVKPESAVETILQNMTNLLILTDDRLTIKKINTAFAKIFDCVDGEVINRSLPG